MWIGSITQVFFHPGKCQLATIVRKQESVLAGEGIAIGASNSDPYATDPNVTDDWVKEGPHLMVVVPDPAMLEGTSRDPNDPVYLMWSDTPYAHIMVKVTDE